MLQLATSQGTKQRADADACVLARCLTHCTLLLLLPLLVLLVPLQLTGYLPEARDPSKQPQLFPEPSKCPSCTNKLSFVEPKTKAARGHLLCTNPACPEQQLGRVKHFVSICVKGIGDATVETLWEKGWLHSPAGLYKLTQVGN